MRFKLSKRQFEFLKYYLSEDQEKLMEKFHSNIEINHDMVYLDLDERTADQIRDWAGGKQQEIGFDKNYELTTEGKILETLIDVFYIK